MKKFYFLLVLALVAIATNASAQFVQSSSQPASNNNANNFFKNMSTSDYNRFYIGYNPTKINFSDDMEDRDADELYTMKHGISFGYLHASNLTNSLPLYIEYGANFQYSFGQETDKEYWNGEYKYTTRMNMYSLNVPVNLALRLSFNNDKVSLTPYVGLNFRLHLAGNIKKTSEHDGDKDSENYDLFDDDDLSDEEFKRFQAGFNFGVGLTYKSLYIGVGHVVDFNKIIDADSDNFAKLGVTTISLGILF